MELDGDHNQLIQNASSGQGKDQETTHGPFDEDEIMNVFEQAEQLVASAEGQAILKNCSPALDPVLQADLNAEVKGEYDINQDKDPRATADWHVYIVVIC